MQERLSSPIQNKTEDLLLYACGLQTENTVMVKSSLAGKPSKLGWQSASN